MANAVDRGNDTNNATTSDANAINASNKRAPNAYGAILMPPLPPADAGGA